VKLDRVAWIELAAEVTEMGEKKNIIESLRKRTHGRPRNKQRIKLIEVLGKDCEVGDRIKLQDLSFSSW
jgi:hypothetical protein